MAYDLITWCLCVMAYDISLCCPHYIPGMSTCVGYCTSACMLHYLWLTLQSCEYDVYHHALYCIYWVVRLIWRYVMWDMVYQLWDESSGYMYNNKHSHNKYSIRYNLTLYHIMLEDGAHIRIYTHIHRQIELLYSVNARHHVRNKGVHLLKLGAYRYQVLYVL